MCKRLVFSCFMLLFAWGCASEPTAQIVSESIEYETVPKHTYRKPSTYKPAAVSNFPDSWIPQVPRERNWTAIVIHHSATRSGNAAIFDNWHREGRHWDGVGYNFVIGNGTDSRDGQIEVTDRWRYQKVGAHCGGTPDNWANKEGVGICMVGDFNKSVPTPAQMQSLIKLISFLQNRYNIPKNRIYGHGNTPGSKSTDCPGKRFQLYNLKSVLEY